MRGKSRRRGRNQWWQLIAFLMKTFHLSIGQIAQMDLVQIYALVEGYLGLYRGEPLPTEDDSFWRRSR
jgi:uncharacterized membrane protein